jgi:flagellar motor switch protein FliN
VCGQFFGHLYWPMSDDASSKHPKVSALAFNELDGKQRRKASDADDSWDHEVADIPDKPRSPEDLEAVYDIPVRVSAVLGKSSMKVSELTKLGRGAVIELDRKVGEAIDLYLNNRLVARGEVVVVDDKLGVTMTEIIKSHRG